MIGSAEEFVRLRSSSNLIDYQRAAHDDAPDAVWLDVIQRFPDYRFWVAHNKTVPVLYYRFLPKTLTRELEAWSLGNGSCPRSWPLFSPGIPVKSYEQQRRATGTLLPKCFPLWPVIRRQSSARLRSNVERIRNKWANDDGAWQMNEHGGGD